MANLYQHATFPLLLRTCHSYADVAPVIVVEAQVDCDSWCGQGCWGNGFPGGDCQGLSDLNACVCHACCYSQALGP